MHGGDSKHEKAQHHSWHHEAFGYALNHVLGTLERLQARHDTDIAVTCRGHLNSTKIIRPWHQVVNKGLFCISVARAFVAVTYSKRLPLKATFQKARISTIMP